jgi:hypothetical protein
MFNSYVELAESIIEYPLMEYDDNILITDYNGIIQNNGL